MFNCRFVLLVFVGKSVVHREFLQLSLSLYPEVCQQRNVPRAYWDETRPNGDTVMRMEAACPSESFAPTTTLPTAAKLIQKLAVGLSATRAHSTSTDRVT